MRTSRRDLVRRAGAGIAALWGLITGGSARVKSVYGQLTAELRAARLLSGVAKVGDITRRHVVLPKPA